MKKIIFLPLLFILILSGCDSFRKTEPITADQLKLLSYMPQQFQYVTYINVDELRKTGFWESFFKPELEKNDYMGWFSGFEKNSGIDLDNGISEILISAGKSKKGVIGILFGKKKDEIENYFNNKNEFTSQRLNGKLLFRKKDGSLPLYYFADNSTLIVLSDTVYLGSIAAGRENSLIKNSKLIDVIKNISNKKYYWMATNLPGYAGYLIRKTSGLNKNFPGSGLIRSIKSITISASFPGNVELESILSCDETRNAYLLSAAIKSYVAMDLFLHNHYSMEYILKKIKVDRDGEKVNLSLKIQKDDLKKLESLTSNNMSNNL